MASLVLSILVVIGLAAFSYLAVSAAVRDQRLESFFEDIVEDLEAHRSRTARYPDDLFDADGVPAWPDGWPRFLVDDEVREGVPYGSLVEYRSRNSGEGFTLTFRSDSHFFDAHWHRWDSARGEWERAYSD